MSRTFKIVIALAVIGVLITLNLLDWQRPSQTRQVVSPARQSKPDSSFGVASPAQADGSAPMAPRGWVVRADPFRTTKQMPVVIEAPPVPEPVQQASVTPPVVHQPFVLLGRLQKNGQEFIYLRKGDDLILAQINTRLDGGFVVAGIDRQHVRLTHEPGNEQFVLSFPAPEHTAFQR